ncbi:MAG TPA: glycosyltransferase family 4 protein [Thermoanaerobaculia bacterium]|nr:glycosyltransferase family 4 protein [Thermoanaerobaculia bacterium]
MKILFISDYFPPERNAPATRVYERAVYWARWGHDVTFITSAPNFPDGKVFAGYRNAWYQHEIVDGIRVVRVKTFIAPNRGVVRRTIDFISFMIMSIAGAFFQKRPDVVTATSPQFFAGLAGAIAAKLHRRPFVLEVGDLWPATIVGVGLMKRSLAIRFIELFEHWMYRRAARIVAVTPSIGKDLQGRGVPAEKIVVALNGVDLHRYGKRPKDPELLAQYALAGKFVAAYIGTHGLSHALERVIEAAKLLEPHDDVRILFVGAGAARDGIMKQAEELGLKNVVFIPEQPKEQIARYWSLSDVALVHLKNSPVFETAVPSKIFEAMAMGLPLIVSGPENGDARAIVEHDAAGLITPPENPEALAEAIVRLKTDHALRQKFAEASYKAAAWHTREEQARRVIAAYESVVPGPPAVAQQERG